MNPSARKAFLMTHNRLRSRLAKGNAMNGNIGMAPQAANMLKMVYIRMNNKGDLSNAQIQKYDCNAEASAMAAALTCSGQLSPPETRPGYKENFIKIHKTYLNLPQTATHASERWWHQLSQHGANGQMSFTHEMRVEKTKIIRNWGKDLRKRI
ncbi:hypothetical protein ANCCAN_29320 [Ancylostoma caninum]|uniref:SCP domain-containing protein n=1 Tax=Ancylostoma caninum TaxID=29170 RepID=A0A368EYR9_ANCCA|nr:hypothetical protein ANCCAN_29320 [Ancylostoma caninum]